MVYFLLRLILSLVVSVLLLLALVRLARLCKLRNLKKKIAFFFPTIVSFILILQVLFSTGPKLLDVLPMIAKRYVVKQVQVEEVLSFHNVRMSDGEIYYFDGFSNNFVEGQLYQISTTNWSNYVAKAKQI